MTILILDSSAEQYRSLLLPQLESVDVQFASQYNENLPDDVEILLGQPNMAAEYIKSGHRARWIQSTWAGIRPLLEPLRTHAKTRLTGIKDLFGPLISEYLFNYLLESVRHSARFATYQTEKNWPDKPPLPGSLQGKILTIIGTGSIGNHVAKVARVFSMKVHGVSRSGKSLTSDYDAMFQNIATAVTGADYVLACLPDTRATENIIDATVFARMKTDSIFFNVGRGSTVDQDALAFALKNKLIASAVIDVLKTEPLAPDDALWETPNLTITPHIAAYSRAEDISEIFLDNLNRYQRGEELLYEIDLSKGY